VQAGENFAYKESHVVQSILSSDDNMDSIGKTIRTTNSWKRPYYHPMIIWIITTIRRTDAYMEALLTVQGPTTIF
jgi:hypothetical protein